jgi:hypothetical protein
MVSGLCVNPSPKEWIVTLQEKRLAGEQDLDAINLLCGFSSLNNKVNILRI